MKLAKRERQETGLLTPLSRGVSPFGALSRLHDEIDRLFEEPFGGWLAPTGTLFEGWTPAVDVCETKDSVVVKAELPGMKKEDIDVSVSESMLNISGERAEDAEYEGAEGYRAERSFGRFHRSIPLPVPVEGDKIHAEYKDGILTITCPKTEEAKRKQIEVKVE
jgi:HSP20 family protein